MTSQESGRKWFIANQKTIAHQMELLRNKLTIERPYTALNTYNPGYRWLSEMQLCDVWNSLAVPRQFRLSRDGVVHQVFKGLAVSTRHLFAVSADQTIVCISPGEFILEGLSDEPFIARREYELQPGERIAQIQQLMPNNIVIAPQFGIAALIATREMIKETLWLDYSEE
jgi:hypothetical protein